MSDPISLASGLVALVVFAFQSSSVLYQTVASFQNNQRTVRELKEELEALDAVLKSLQEIASITTADLASLKLPLLRCGKACQEFEALLVKCTAHSGGSRKSFRDWAKLKYMDDDIVGFKTMLAQYKATISIALCDANIRTSIVTVTVLNQYKELIANTTVDLQEHLEKIDKRLQSFSLQDGRTSDEVTAERQQIQEERDSTQQCLGICAQVSTHIDQLQPNVFQDISTPTATYRGPAAALNGTPPARVVTVDAFNACKTTLNNTTTQLEKHLQDINNHLQKLTPQQPSLFAAAATSTEQAGSDRKTMEEEMYSIRECLAICSKAAKQADQDRANNFFEDVSHAGDGSQVIVSTIGDLIFARRVSAGPKSMQLLGQMSDDTVQKLSLDHRHSSVERATATAGTVVAEPQTGKTGAGAGGAGVVVGDAVAQQYEDRYGVGNRLNLLNLEDGAAAAAIVPK